MRHFVQRHLAPVDRLGEVVFGLIMALGFTAAVRLGREEPGNRELFIAILGCNVAWGIVDGVMSVMTTLFRRGVRTRVVREVAAAADQRAARERVAREAQSELLDLASPEQRQRLLDELVELARSMEPEPPRVRRDDLLGAVAVGTIIVMATAPLLVPYLVVPDPDLAVRLSNGIGLLELFVVGVLWGRYTGGNRWAIGGGVMLVGLVLVLITVSLGG